MSVTDGDTQVIRKSASVSAMTSDAFSARKRKRASDTSRACRVSTSDWTSRQLDTIRDVPWAASKNRREEIDTQR